MSELVQAAAQLGGVVGPADGGGWVVDPAYVERGVGQPGPRSALAQRYRRVHRVGGGPARVQLLPGRAVPAARVHSSPGTPADLRVHRIEWVQRIQRITVPGRAGR